jgi:hypothetical protein
MHEQEREWNKLHPKPRVDTPDYHHRTPTTTLSQNYSNPTRHKTKRSTSLCHFDDELLSRGSSVSSLTSHLECQRELEEDRARERERERNHGNLERLLKSVKMFLNTPHASHSNGTLTMIVVV